MNKRISVNAITKNIADACVDINLRLPPDMQKKLTAATKQEGSPAGKSVLDKLVLNSQLAAQEHLPICQDTGLVVAFVELGQEVSLVDGDLNTAIHKGVAQGYQTLRKSVVADPLQRNNTNDNTPAVIHTTIVPGNNLVIHLMAKGGGAENKSALKMFAPTVSPGAIKEFILETVKKADAAACPPLVIGVGIGGTFDYCTVLAKKALLRKVESPHNNSFYANLEKTWLDAVNTLGVGPAGYGGSTTALALFIETYPCHIASLPVAVNIQCHANRHATISF